MKRWTLALALAMGLACCGTAWSADVKQADVEHKRGDFKFYVGPAPAFVEPHPVAATWDPKAPGADEKVWRYWLYDEQTDHRGGIDASYTDYAYESRTTGNVRDAGKYQIEFNPEYQRLVLHAVALRRDGKWEDRLLPDKISLARRETDFENDLSDGRVTALIVLDDVRVGDVVRVSYTITGSNPILAGQGWDGVATAWRSPMHDLHMRVLYDPGTQVQVHQRNGAPAPTVLKEPDAVEATLDVHGATPVVDEGNYPVWFDPSPRLHLGPARGWNDVVAWAMPLYPAAGALPADLQARIAEWRKLPDANARLTAALRAVQDEVRYFGVEMGSNTHRPADPSETWPRRYGDCKDKAYLLSTILAQLDIRGVPALVSTTRGRGLREIEPTAAAFNHVIVRATIDDKPVWVDPTMTQQGGDPRTLDLSDYGVGLPIVAGTTALEEIAPPAKAEAGMDTVERYTPEGKDGSLKLEIETTYRGMNANYARSSLAGSRPDEMERRYADYYRKRFGELESVQAPKVVDDRNANVLKMSESYVLRAPFEVEGNIRGLDVWAETLDGISQLPSTMARKGPMETGTPAAYRHEVSIAAPQGWRATVAPEHEKYSSPAFDFARDISKDGETVKVVYDFKVTASDIDGARATAHLEQMRKVRDALSARLRFAPPAATLEASERDKRLKSLLRDVLDSGSGDTSNTTQGAP
ncbi:DUF3857 domain-containing protein [Lysobacter sp. A6]|uniref:DUF3857 domain-containing protein n=1 Tax=Noviluteimonas lactosilytica TaxID=2888523 RepID=A0ABS8JKN0_9GAMM|nr:DUF3857 domain-containing protein [Lysobacter lactosilyticus]MCC8364137.1 DUF3857 domain-containing protein [Lysobacter lactosilyticus]